MQITVASSSSSGGSSVNSLQSEFDKIKLLTNMNGFWTDVTDFLKIDWADDTLQGIENKIFYKKKN